MAPLKDTVQKSGTKVSARTEVKFNRISYYFDICIEIFLVGSNRKCLNKPYGYWLCLLNRRIQNSAFQFFIKHMDQF